MKNGKGPSTQEREDWEAVITAWQQVLRDLDKLDVLLLGLGEREMAQELLRLSLPMTVKFVYRAAEHGVQVG